jgi:hypothetical protein
MAASISFPIGVFTATEHLNPIPFPFDAGVPGNPVIPPNPIFPLIPPASPIINALFGGITTTVDVLGIADIHGDTPLIG